MTLKRRAKIKLRSAAGKSFWRFNYETIDLNFHSVVRFRRSFNGAGAA
jgi:hypothetical protein